MNIHQSLSPKTQFLSILFVFFLNLFWNCVLWIDVKNNDKCLKYVLYLNIHSVSFIFSPFIGRRFFDSTPRPPVSLHILFQNINK